MILGTVSVCFWPLAAVGCGLVSDDLMSGTGESGHSSGLGVRFQPQSCHSARVVPNDRY
jgi:hypothetical protein